LRFVLNDIVEAPHPPGHKFDGASELSVHSTEQATVIGKRPF
jgi:hypothetical protein